MIESIDGNKMASRPRSVLAGSRSIIAQILKQIIISYTATCNLLSKALSGIRTIALRGTSNTMSPDDGNFR